jgi:hypothetical protein
MVLAMISCYVQTISLFETIFVHFHEMLKNLNGRPVTHLLDRIDRVLGLPTADNPSLAPSRAYYGLLSRSHLELL